MLGKNNKPRPPVSQSVTCLDFQLDLHARTHHVERGRSRLAGVPGGAEPAAPGHPDGADGLPDGGG